eukprot:TRINITY_DN4173_c0_g1_i2.p1 TRINITY_DN4173_c0_g1~~TRINITY_DN4173_c0_g1_i2.p1  ORF type:complete len:112 (-),score=35.24 TRINITY_DN4173_c0_g1_i2:50-385(-)
MCIRDRKLTKLYPILINTPTEADHLRRIAKRLLGDENVSSEGVPVYASEDFAYFTQERPGAFIFLSSGFEDGKMVIHQSDYNFNDELIPIGSRFWYEVMLDRLAPSSVDKA